MIRDKKIPIVSLFPKIINRKAFINNVHPKINPALDRDRYINYWEEEKRRCIEGFWGREKEEHWRWMNPDLYHYVNHWTIKHTRKGSQAEIPIKPYLRDTEWIISTAWTVCIGFSGFTDDEEYSSHDLLKKYYDEKEGVTSRYGLPVHLTKSEKRRLDQSNWVKTKDGHYKKYIDPLEALKKHYAEPKGLPIYENETKDLFLLSSRGTGKSYFASAVAGREWTFDGRKYYKTDLFEHGGEIGSVFCGAEPKDKVDSLYDKIFFGLDNYDGSFEDVEVKYPSPFFKFRKGTFSTSTVIKHEYDVYYPAGGSDTKGKGTQMHKGIFRNNPDAAVGERKNTIVVEEAALAEQLPLIHANNKNVIIRNGKRIGKNFYIGTGGNVAKIGGARKLFNAPAENDFLVFNNHWDKGQEIGLFIPVEYTLEDFKDENGNTILEEAREHQMAKRALLAQGKDSTAFTRNRMFEPISPDDMFLSNDMIIFDQGRISSRLSDLSGVDDWMEKATFGELKSLSNRPGDVVPTFSSFAEAIPIVSKDVDESLGKRGAIVFHKHPPKGIQFRMKRSRFRLTYDPIKIEGDGPSLGSILVLDTIDDTIAAEYIGRRESPEDIHDIAINLALYYNCPILYESNVDGFLGHCRRRGVAHYLYPTPVTAIAKTTKNPKIRHGEVGITLTGPIKRGAILQAQNFMNKLDEDGIDLYSRMNSTRLLEEMEVWDGKENADHISSFLLQALWEEEEREMTLAKEVDLQDQYKSFREELLKRRNSRYNIERELYTYRTF